MVGAVGIELTTPISTGSADCYVGHSLAACRLEDPGSIYKLYKARARSALAKSK